MEKPTYILGISAYFHDSAACLLADGKIIAASSEERFTRIKHDSSFPIHAIEFCLKKAGITNEQIDHVAFYEKPFLKFERILETSLSNFPYSFSLFKNSIESWLSKKLWITSKIQSIFGKNASILYAKHHESHAASSCFTSPFQEGAFLTIDGIGESETITIGTFNGNQLNTQYTQNYPHSLGLFYSAFTHYCGFKANSGEYKLMGLAPYGNPIYKELLLKHFISVDESGIIEISTKNLPFHTSNKILEKRIHKILGFPKREMESKELEQCYKDLAASVQSITEEIMIRLVGYTLSKFNTNNLCLAGGVALNCSANGKLLKTFPNVNFWIQPAAGDSGGALGAALIAHHQYLQNKERITFDSCYLGPEYNEEEIANELSKYPSIQFEKIYGEEKSNLIAACLNQKKIVGWFSGRAEWGPRALGNRSILASPVFDDMKSYLNLKIKKREGFRPFAPVILEEKAYMYFDIKLSSPYMLFNYESRQPEKTPSCVHVNNTSRVQTINMSQNLEFYNLISAFETYSGIPCLINTSFNQRGEPIVNNPFDALNCFFNTEMDILVLGNHVLFKEKQKNIPLAFNNTNNYELD